MEELPANGAVRVRLSAKTGVGMAELDNELRSFLLARRGDPVDDLVLTNTRHQELVTRTVAQLAASCAGLEGGVPHEMVLLNMYDALAALNELTGEVVTEDILDRIFSSFCIGK
jgi:tRNA modification GTPase